MITRIKAIIDSMGLPFRYGNPSQINYYLQNVDYAAAPDGVAAYCYLLTDSEYVNGKEGGNVAVFFSTLIDFDFDGQQALNATDMCKAKAKEFLPKVAQSNLIRYDGARFQYGYDDFAENVAWCAVRAYFEDMVPDCVSMPKPVIMHNWLTFTAIDEVSTIKLYPHGNPLIVNLQYSKDGVTWTTFVNGNEFNVITLDIGEYVYIRGNNARFSLSSNDFYNFVITGKVAASGNITSLLNENAEDIDDLTESWIFVSLFSGCSQLITSPTFNIKKISGSNCLSRLFNNCVNLTRIEVKFEQWDTHNSISWVTGVGSTGLFYLPTGTSYTTSTSGVPSGWEVIEY